VNPDDLVNPTTRGRPGCARIATGWVTL